MRQLACGIALWLVLASAGCGSDGVSSPEPPRVQSEPLPLSPALVSESQAQVSAVTTGVAYVSAAPGAFPTGRQATIRNPATGGQEVVPMVNGGWDPVSIAAEPGDTLRISVTTEEGGTVEYANPVPPLYRPVIVRTDPPPRKRDVPLNVVMLVVFSEPIDPATITPQRVQLLRDGQPVDAGIELSTDGLRMTIRPQDELVPGTEYVLVVSPEISDRSGDRLESGAEVEFTTFKAAAGRGLAFMVGGNLVVSALDGSAKTSLLPNGARPAWSPDGTRLAFTRPAELSLAGWQVCIAKADGTGIRCTDGDKDGEVVGGPSWSPDGGKVAFSVYVYCSGECGQSSGDFSSLLLLNTLTMEIETLPTRPVRSVSWSPDGRKIAISIWEPATTEPRTYGVLGTVNPDGSGLEILGTQPDSYSVTNVSWSPDGSRLALTLWSQTICPWLCDTAIGVINVDGTQLRVVDRAHASGAVFFQTPPAWSPDGVHLAYTVSRGDGCYYYDFPCNEIAVLRVDSGRSEFVISGAAFPTWRP